MSAYAPASLKGIYAFVKNYIASAKDGGTLANKSGYHNSRNRLKASASWKNDYSIQDSRDKQGDGDAAAAFDITMSDVDMRKTTARVVAAMRAKDERIVGKLREFGGTLNSSTVTAYRVEDQKAISFDKTHLWHFHGSVFRKYATDESVCRGIAQVVAGVASTPFIWDGVSFPGASNFFIGAEGPWVTWLGQRLVAHGWAGYTSGPGPTFTTADQAAVKWFQEKQGWTGSDADGFPGAQTWIRLSATPSVPPVPSEPVLYPEPKTDLVYQEVLVSGRKDSDSVWQMQTALRKLGYDVKQTGAYDEQTIEAVKRYQASLGDKVLDGLVGPLQTARLFKDAGFNVQIIQPEAKPPATPKPPTTPTPTPTPPKEEPAVSTATETIMGLNILRRTDTVAGRKRWPARKPLLGKHLRDAKASVYLLIETDATTRKDMGAELGSNFTWWGFKYYGVYWDQRVWERVGNATNQIQFRDKENRWLLSIPLRHKATGKILTFDVTHLENDGGGSGDWGHQKRFVEATHLAELAHKGNRVGFFDCNSTTSPTTTSTARQRQKPRPILAKAGAKFLSQIKSKVKNSEYATHHGGKGSSPKGAWIDDAWVMGDVQLVDGELVRTDGTDASDHHGLKFRIKF